MLRVILQLVPVLILSYSAQVLLKRGVNSVGATNGSLISANPVGVLTSFLFNWSVISGFIVAGIGAVLYLLVITQTDLTVALPLLGGLSTSVLPLIGRFVLHENVSLGRMIGIVIVVVGMFIVARN